MRINPERKKIVYNERSYFKPILQILQDNGEELNSLSELDKYIPQYSDITEDEINYTEISKKGNKNQPYRFGRNFAVTNLRLAGFLNHERGGLIKLTEKGKDFDAENLDPTKDIYPLSMPYWKAKETERQKRKEKTATTETPEGAEEILSDDSWRDEIIQKITKLDPFKFESFARGLLSKMGFEIDRHKGVRCSNDGGIDGFGYSIDQQSLRTTRVALQCKRYAVNHPVSNADINNLRGAVDTHRAEYGIFITTSYFSETAKEISKQGGTPITLIDGNKLVDLMIQYEYKVRKTWMMEG